MAGPRPGRSGWSPLPGLDWTIIRPPAVYGPGDRETLELFKMARRGLVALPPAAASRSSMSRICAG